MTCEYCADFYECEPILNTRDRFSSKGDFCPGIAVGIEEGSLCVVSVADVYEPNYQEERIKIKFCPMCGRALE